MKTLPYHELKIDILWILNYLVNLYTLTPFWAGWNSTLIEPMQYTQKVLYLPQINQSPTNHSIIAETMLISSEMAQESMENSGAVIMIWPLQQSHCKLKKKNP